MNAIILLLLATTSKPVCNAANHGRYWPDAANGNPQAVRELAQSGTLEMCSAGTWKYKWVPLSIHVNKLVRKHP